ncbi:MAG: TetR/AcrR family transcriptional regulator [Selenomonadaceae bacterium]|nr:TetR/AcrR family transcriptional regulator [Selenomonadaceae bacterium]
MSKKINLREQKKLEYRQKILSAAVHEFKERGFLNTSVSNIMQKADLGVGTFYNYFGSKEEVLMNLVKNLFAEVEEKIQAQAKLKISSIELLESCCMHTAEIIDENKFVLPLLSSAAEHSDKPEQSPKNLSPGFKEIFGKIISFGQERGQIRRDIPTDLISEMFHSIYQAAAFSKLKISFKENVRLKVKILLDGIALKNPQA